jgi:hypothetical protein
MVRARFLCGIVLLFATSGARAEGIAYAFDLRGDDNLFSFPANDPTSQTQIGPIAPSVGYATFGMDFNTAGTTLYAINHEPGALEVGTVDINTGVYTMSAPIATPAPNETGLSVDPTDDSLYLSTGTSLYTLNPGDGATALVGNFSGMTPGGLTIGTVIDIAIDNSGQMYAHDISTDSLWSVNKATGAATFVGGSGLAGNFAQGMDFDPTSNLLYAAIYVSGGTGSYGTWNTSTGAFNQILPLGSFPDPAGANGRELEMAIRVPEPASASLLALAGLMLLRRR